MFQRTAAEVRALPPRRFVTVGLILSMLAGYLEAYTYLLRDGVFCNGQTANIAMMMLSFAEGNLKRALHYPLPISAFFMGVVFAGYLRELILREKRFRWEVAFLLFEAAVLFFVGLIPLTASSTVPNLLVTFVCAVQYAAFRQTRGLPYASIFCTGNLRSAADHFYILLRDRKREAGITSLRYLTVIAAFIAGVFIGAHLAHLWGARSIWVGCLMLLGLIPKVYRSNPG